ncbi:MAG: sensor histidine kinase [Chloroflexi bacterium]|nr:sensor histidine kinase [Chloroflexota bacterium]
MKFIRNCLTDNTTSLVGIIAPALIGGVGVLFFFLDALPYRWLALALTTLFMALIASMFTASWWYESNARRRLLLGLMIVSVVALLLLPPHFDVFLVLFFVISVNAALVLEPDEWRWWIAGFAVIAVLYFYFRTQTLNGVLASFVYIAGFYFFAAFAKAMTDARDAQAESQRLYQDLQAAHRQLQDYAEQVEQLAVMEERSRLAREMHDTLGHRLTVAAVQLEAAQRLVDRDPERAKSMMATVHEQVNEALGELRRTVAALRAPLEEDLSLTQSLTRLADAFQAATGVQVDLDLPEVLPDLPPALRNALYRAAQESLTNVQKHAHASRVWLELRCQNGSVSLRVSDDGVGLAERASSSGFGVKGLRERAAQLGGEFQLKTRPEGGAEASFHAPLSNL